LTDVAGILGVKDRCVMLEIGTEDFERPRQLEGLMGTASAASYSIMRRLEATLEVRDGDARNEQLS